ncbi:helix-turn-helix domain-containing protein [Pseudalkalibacillus hwajinpoensis]|uniref:helix-turn-helix domain-containing protein n=1 Tax=Guptibacillus hwajinpoensis TaxID=208199 RepID=UPI001CD41B2D|nr:helix-turn-helix transcriptional regulator [Pseudalkalibacillus hwajinpoensis]MCA0992972.1 helix-turn-helix domain-containing protein [Pseudalkalibacillus hwajinpoensis]
MDAEVLKHLRIISGLTQKELSDRVDVSSSLITKIEKRERTLQPDLEKKVLTVFSEVGLADQEITSLDYILKRTTANKT